MARYKNLRTKKKFILFEFLLKLSTRQYDDPFERVWPACDVTGLR